jgi:hypothetical protein
MSERAESRARAARPRQLGRDAGEGIRRNHVDYSCDDEERPAAAPNLCTRAMIGMNESMTLEVTRI